MNLEYKVALTQSDISSALNTFFPCSTCHPAGSVLKMKLLLLILFAATIAMAASADSVPAPQTGWTPAGPLHSWQDYCTPKGVHRLKFHVCVSTDGNIILDSFTWNGMSGIKSSNPYSKFQSKASQWNRCS